MWKYYGTGTLLRFLQNYCVFVTKKYWALEKKEILYLAIFNLLSFLWLRNIRWTYSKDFRNNIYENISSASQWSTTWCSFSVILYTFNVCNKSLHLEWLQCVNIKNNCQFLVGHICVGKFTFIKIGFSRKKNFNFY